MKILIMYYILLLYMSLRGPNKINAETLSNEEREKYKKFLGVCGLAADLLRSNRYISKVECNEENFLVAGTRRDKHHIASEWLSVSYSVDKCLVYLNYTGCGIVGSSDESVEIEVEEFEESDVIKFIESKFRKLKTNNRKPLYETEKYKRQKERNKKY